MESMVLRRKQVAAMLGVSVSTLWRWGQARGFGFPRPVRLGARSVGFLKADIDAWVANRERAC